MNQAEGTEGPLAEGSLLTQQQLENLERVNAALGVGEFVDPIAADPPAIRRQFEPH